MCRRLVFPALILLLATGAFAQTTGTIEGTIVDETNQALPGVTVEATSPALQGAKVVTSDADGRFRLVLLPPGAYSVKFALQSFAAQEQSGINVGLGRTVTLQVSMRSAFKEEVVVSGAAPTIDVRSTEVGSNVDQTTFLNLPVQRNFAAVIQVAPGTATDAAGVTVYGSTGAENAYFIDGVNTTGVQYGTQGKLLNFEFIQEAQVKTGGYEAEYGRATGGLINVITKSGGNEFHGDVFGYYQPSGTQSGLKSGTIKGADDGAVPSLISSSENSDYGLGVGGFMFKDKLWFFGAYNHVKGDEDNEVFRDFREFGGTDYGFPHPGDVFVRNTTRDLWAGKLTYRPNQNHAFIASAFGDPSTEDGPSRQTQRYPMASQPSVFMQEADTGGTDATLKYEGVLGANLVANVQLARHKDTNEAGGAGFGQVRFYDRTHPLYLQAGIAPNAGGYGPTQRSSFGRDVYRADLAYFLPGYAGEHEIKGGMEYEDISVYNENFNSGGQRIYKFTGTLDGAPVTFYRHRFYTRRHGSDSDPLTNTDIVDPLVVDTMTRNQSVFAQDSWRPVSNLTIALGVRWESQKLYNSERQVAVDINDNWAPRLGFVWDFSNTGAAKLYGSWGRFYQTIPVDMIIRSFGNEITAFTYNTHGAFDDPNRLDVTPDPVINTIRRNSILGGDTPVDPNLKGQYTQEYILGADLLVAHDWVLGGKLIRRELAQVIEDGLMPDGSGNYVIGNPGRGILSKTMDDSATFTFDVPGATRTFTGVELSVRKRFADRWSFLGSYLWSTLEGNYDGVFQASTGQLDPNVNSAFDEAEFQINNDGPLTNDRRHQLKLDGTYEAPFGLTIGASAYWRSGVPITAYGYSYGYENWEYYLSKRGEFGRTDDEYELDLHLGYPWKVSGVRVNVLVDVFNLLNRQGEINRNMQYTLSEDYYVLDYDNGTVLPAIRKGDTAHPPTNPAFNHANAWQDPRTIRFGVRLSF